MSEGEDKPHLNSQAEPYTPPYFVPQKLRLHQIRPPHLVHSGHWTPQGPHPVFDGDLGKKLGKMEVPRTPFCKERKRGGVRTVLAKAWVAAENAMNDDVVCDDPKVVLNGSTIEERFAVHSRQALDEANAMADSKEEQSEYDFVYVPVDFKMYQAYHNFRWECLPIKNLNFRSKKVCEISPTKIRGKVALECSFKSRAFPYREYQPVVATETPGNGHQKNGLLIVLGKCPGAASAREARAEAPMVISGEQFGGCEET
ncbi:hypothetical protein ACJRO7_022810 [Eucalyptus globulus]|uniref:Uncharacterized protein n=1 Tax=Eucalyptus globulus TaxID=34317 RepID=A0ABD3JZM9_EUCGL